jgi:hypothetical protein
MYAESATLESPLDSSKYIIAQLVCPAQRSLMQEEQLGACGFLPKIILPTPAFWRWKSGFRKEFSSF